MGTSPCQQCKRVCTCMRDDVIANTACYVAGCVGASFHSLTTDHTTLTFCLVFTNWISLSLPSRRISLCVGCILHIIHTYRTAVADGGVRLHDWPSGGRDGRRVHVELEPGKFFPPMRMPCPVLPYWCAFEGRTKCDAALQMIDYGDIPVL